MPKHKWMINYATENGPVKKIVQADYFDEEGSLVTFYEDPDAGTGAGGPVFGISAEYVISIERTSRPASVVQE